MIRCATLPAVGLLLAACASPTPSPVPTTAPAGLPADHVLLAVDDVSGWPGFEGVQDRRLITLTADGTIVARDPGVGTILSTALSRLDAAALDQVWSDVVASGVAMDGSFDLPGLFDANTTTFRVDDGTRSTSLSIYALGSDPADRSFEPREGRLRTTASSLVASLRERGRDQPWTPPALLLWWNPYPVAPSGLQPRVVEWTPPVDLETAGKPVESPVYERCARLEGGSAAAVAALARTVPPDVAVEQAGARYAVAVRPIYPDELGDVACP